ncbi:MAG TPA: class I SAM-dependent methyltransferase [Bacteroidales bacterium]|nr:class I SAM-dependent methyltransferase [Bacteroidales bacterium]HPF01650.1 class I SAM-dependent methyltransferase [Bacteroidales bacterium]HPJ58659.1 class I SAM-dependent methyltransferase [Bacteroidales bacterium]HPR12346.1 class I SAM-dependent methyltransferase [Bacteroidales bacterium]HRW84566.1 class I SAM-dependent methyltransferase [Bacteroidales bacterium]
MKKSEKIKLLISSPWKILNSGLNVQKEEYYHERNLKRYGMDRLPTVDLCELFPCFSETVHNYTYLDGTSLPVDIMLLKSLARQYERCAYLEIGSWRGESLSNIYEVTDDCTSVTLSEAEMLQIGKNINYAKVHGIFTKNLKDLKTIEQNSRSFDFGSLNRKFDLIFIDGDHSYEGVLNDTRKTLSLRRNSKSVIVWHDYGMSTEMVRYSVLAGILDGIPKELHQNLYHVSNTLCAVYIENGSFNTYFTNFPSTPNKVFTIEMRAHKKGE